MPITRRRRVHPS